MSFRRGPRPWRSLGGCRTPSGNCFALSSQRRSGPLGPPGRGIGSNVGSGGRGVRALCFRTARTRSFLRDRSSCACFVSASPKRPYRALGDTGLASLANAAVRTRLRPPMSFGMRMDKWGVACAGAPRESVGSLGFFPSPVGLGALGPFRLSGGPCCLVRRSSIWSPLWPFLCLWALLATLSCFRALRPAPGRGCGFGRACFCSLLRLRPLMCSGSEIIALVALHADAACGAVTDIA